MTYDQTVEATADHSKWLAEPLAVQHGQVSGIPAFWVPGPGKPMAGIVFRCGIVDETLPVAGINHMIKHLLSKGNCVADADHSWVTSVATQGSIDEVLVEFARIEETIAGGFRAVEGARHIVRTELDQRRLSPIDELLLARHGATGLGVRAFDEYANLRVSDKELREWTTKYFHGGNAAVWMAGEFPKAMGLEIPHRSPAPAPSPRDRTIPAASVVTGQPDVLGVSLIGGDSRAFRAIVWLATRRLAQFDDHFAECRSVEWRVEHCADGQVEFLCTAKIVETQGEQLSRAFLGIFEELSSSPCSPELLDEYRESVAAEYFDGSGGSQLAHAEAVRHLLGERSASWQITLDELSALDSGSIVEVMRRSMGSAIVMLPSGVSSHARFPLLETRPALAEGADFPAVRLKGEPRFDRSLTASPEGIRLVSQGVLSSVAFAHVALVVREANGVRELIGYDGQQVRVDPQCWKRGELLTALIDKAVASSRTVIASSSASAAVSSSPRRKIATWRLVAAGFVVALILLTIGVAAWRLTGGNDTIVNQALKAQGMDTIPKCSEVDLSQVPAGTRVKCQTDQMNDSVKYATTGIVLLTIFGVLWRVRYLLRLLRRILGH